MTLKECYEQLHGDYELAVNRLMNERMVSKFILKFPADTSMALLRESMLQNNHDDAFRAVHTLKGVAANLSFTELQTAASNLTEQLRHGEIDSSSGDLLAEVEESYALVIKTLEQYKNENN